MQVNISIGRLTRLVTQHKKRPARHADRAVDATLAQPVVFFNASARIVGVSQNAAFSLLAAAGLLMEGVPVIYFACKAGMKRCVLGTQLDDLTREPPCKACIRQASWLFAQAPSVEYVYHEQPELLKALSQLDIQQMMEFRFQGYPLGELVLPSMRWVLRRHHLQDDEPTRSLYRDYICSAFVVGKEFRSLLMQVEPQAVVVFNGMFFPEAVARFIAQRRNIPVITHEVGLRPFTAFFTYGEATAYPLEIGDDFQLSPQQNERLDRYLAQRFKGDFSMAGIQFWKGMSGLGEEFEQAAARFRQVVPVFTNVIFDTSQPHSNVVFEHMFAWLDLVLELADEHPDTLFVLRAHPDESRVWKESRESVAQWVETTKAAEKTNVLFIQPRQSLSSYELISRSKFVMIYNSTIGLEASILGIPVLCGGRARFTQLDTVVFPKTVSDYKQKAQEWLEARTIKLPPAFRLNARRFLYYQLFMSSLPFEDFLQDDGIWAGFVKLKKISWQQLTRESSETLRTIVNGVINRQEFILPEEKIQD